MVFIFMDIWIISVQICALHAECVCRVFHTNANSHKYRKVRLNHL